MGSGKIGFGGGIEKSVELKEFALGDWIVLVVMTFGATGGQPEPDGGRGADPVDRGFATVFFLVHSTFLIGEGVSMEAGGDFLGEIRIGQEVAGELLDRELVEGKVPIDGVDDPVAVKVGIRAGGIFFVAIAIGVAGQVEPMAAPAFAKVWGSQELIDESGPTLRGRISGKGGGSFRGWGQAEEIQAEAADERARISFRRREHGFFFELGQDEMIDGIADPLLVFNGGQGWASWRGEGPVTRRLARRRTDGVGNVFGQERVGEVDGEKG